MAGADHIDVERLMRQIEDAAHQIELAAAAQDVLDQLATRYDDDWATGPVRLASLDRLRDALAVA